jgi:DNA-binding LacI/PurR family transcriptional regulator
MNAIGIIAEFNHPGDMNIVLLQLLDGVFEASVVTGQRVIVYPLTTWIKDEKHVMGYCDGSVDGYIFLGPRLSPDAARHFYRSAPMVTVHNAGAASGAINLDIDSEQGAYMATKHLIDLGHKRIAHVTGAPSRSGTDDRVAGFQRAMAEQGLEFPQEFLIRGFYSTPSGIEAAHEFMKRFDKTNMPTAVFCANDASACGFVGGLRARGIRVPEDVSVIGFDDEPTAHLPVLELTTIRQPLRSIGVHSVTTLLKSIDELAGEPDRLRDSVFEPNRSEHFKALECIRTDFRSIIFSPSLVKRKTTAPPRD